MKALAAIALNYGNIITVIKKRLTRQWINILTDNNNNNNN